MKRRISVKIIIACILLLTIVGCSKKDFDLNSFTDQIGDYKKDKVVTGQEALTSISQLHGKDIRIEKGFIAQYLNKSKEPAVIWVSVSPTEKDAQDLFANMDSKITSSGAFSNRQEKEVKGIKTIYVYGMNMDNYYYVIDKEVFWFAIPGKDTIKDLELFMDKLN